jgi:nitroreductase
MNRPVEREVIEECINLAIQAPTGSNQQKWHFLVVTDAKKRAAIAELYRKSFELYRGSDDESEEAKEAAPIEGADARQMWRVASSARYLSKNMQHVPVLVILCYEGRVEKEAPFVQAGFYGSILPAAWSLMLALRARGLGSAWTTLHMRYEKEAAAILGIPGNVTQAVLLPVAYYTGEDFKPARRIPADRVTHWNGWDME